jgi:FdhD protein
VRGAEQVRVRRIAPEARSEASRVLPVEAAVAVEVNGLAYAVMMATPLDLVDFAAGFLLSERLVASVADIRSVEAVEVPLGWRLIIELAREPGEAWRERVRVRVAEGSCGLCGLESLEQVARPLPPVPAGPAIADAALFAALGGLRAHQPLNAETGGLHAAAFCAPDGRVLLAREDVGRHNALDKLIGAMARAGTDPASGFMLLSARCSHELVEKTVIAGCPCLVSISTATTLAVARAHASGLRLVALARPDAMLEMC